MKVKILILLLSGIIFGCKHETEFTGYIVAKEYTPGHMSDQTPNTYTFQVIIVPHVPAKPRPHFEESKWVWFIANKNETIEKRVDSLTFNTKKCGDKVTVKY